MPRGSRKKAPKYIHHLMLRSMSELNLFKCDADKLKYLKLLKKYTDQFQCSVLGYCLMTNHVHIHFDPQGGDISKVMHGVNQSYAMYYNCKYKRHGHVLQNRFTNKVVLTDRYNLTLSAYIHNNPKDILGYSAHVEDYPFSSFGIYLGQKENLFDLVNTDFILGYFGGHENLALARKLYCDFVFSMRGAALNSEAFEPVYRQIVTKTFYPKRTLFSRHLPPTAILDDLQDYANNTLQLKSPINIKEICAHSSNTGTFKEFKALAATLMRSLGNCTYKQLGTYLGGISESAAAKLHQKGCFLLISNAKYKKLLDKYKSNYQETFST